uniref:Uncharacterized protein n=1 Tax=Amphimedon queenslandica TaxID=400682 RepID=A0A1X7VP92_AMPQE
MAVKLSAFLFLFAVCAVSLSTGMRNKDFLYCSRQAGCQGPSISMERDPALCCSSIVKGQSYSYTEISAGGVCYSCLTARDEFLYCYTKAECQGNVVAIEEDRDGIPTCCRTLRGKSFQLKVNGKCLACPKLLY